MKNRKLKTVLECLMQGRIVEAINESDGWKNEKEDNVIYVMHCKIKNFFFDRAFQKLPAKYRIKLLTKLSHKKHFTEGVSKSCALEYYYLNRDAYEQDGVIFGLEGGSVNMTTEMKAYYHSIDETVIEIANNKALLKDLAYEVAKPLRNLFYERLEEINFELSYSSDVTEEVFVAGPIPYKEYRIGKHAIIKCFEPDIAFGMEIHGIRDSLKPIHEYISDIMMFLDTCKEKHKIEFKELDKNVLDKILVQAEKGKVNSRTFHKAFNFIEDEHKNTRQFETADEVKKFLLENGVPETEQYKYVFTCVDGEGTKLYLLNGWHMCNRLYYLVSTTSWSTGNKEKDANVYIEANY